MPSTLLPAVNEQAGKMIRLAQQCFETPSRFFNCLDVAAFLYSEGKMSIDWPLDVKGQLEGLVSNSTCVEIRGNALRLLHVKMQM